MYNRILKRPMFKRGGSSYEAQGTGITSPYDTPRKKYQLGSWGEWEEQTRKATKDPRGDWSYAAQGFSELGNPYKESGEAKTIGEMLYAGAAGVRGSREKASDLEKKGELAILESQGGRMLSDEERAFKAEENRLEREKDLEVAKSKGVYPDMHPGKIYDAALKTWRTWVHNNRGQDGYEVVSKNVESFADADLVIRLEKIKSYDANKTSLAHAVPAKAFKDDGTIDISILSGGVVYYDPMDKQWFTISNPGTDSAEPIIVESYIEGWHNIDKGKSPDSSQKTVDELSETDETLKTKKKEAKKYTKEDYETSVAEKWEGMKKGLKERFTFKGDITQGVNPYKPEETLLTDNITFNKGGRVGYQTGDVVDPLDDLKAWWKEQVWNKDEG